MVQKLKHQLHPEHLRKGIPKGQFLRVRRNCSDDNDFKMEAADLTRRFQARGYPGRSSHRRSLQQKVLHARIYYNPKYNNVIQRTSNVIYGIQCPCQKVYVGQDESNNISPIYLWPEGTRHKTRPQQRQPHITRRIMEIISSLWNKSVLVMYYHRLKDSVHTLRRDFLRIYISM